MVYEPVKYHSREEAVKALQKMVQRKREWAEKAEQELAELAKLKPHNV